MNTVERFRNTLAFKPVDRLPAIEWVPYWNLTLDRWYKEGLPENLTHDTEIQSFFGLDKFERIYFDSHGPTCPVPSHNGAPLVKDMDDYLKIKKHLYPKAAFDQVAMESYSRQQQEGQAILWLQILGFFWHPRTLFGIEPHMYAFYDNPELMHMMNADLLEYNLWVLDKLHKVCIPVIMTFAEDMSYNNGPMLSKSCYDEFIAPYYKKIIPQLKEYGISVFVDSDGDVTTLLPWLEDAGVEGIWPLERMAGVDVSRIRQNHPRLRMLGAFDKTVMHKGEVAMRAEFERLMPTMRQGGFIPAVDHQTPPDVSLETYRCYVSLLKEYCTKASK